MRTVLLVVLMLAALGSPLAGLGAGAPDESGCGDGGSCCCAAGAAKASECGGAHENRCGTQLVPGCRCGQHPGEAATHAASGPIACGSGGAALPSPAIERPVTLRNDLVPCAPSPAPEPPPPRATR